MRKPYILKYYGSSGKETMKIFEVRVTNDYDWYKIGSIYTVYESENRHIYPLIKRIGLGDGREAIGIRKEDCIIINRFKEEIERILGL